MNDTKDTYMDSTYTYPWIPDAGDGTFRNPVLHADYSDPDVIRHGADFWMVASSFNCTPGLPILHSRDLVNWRLVNHAIRQVPHQRYAQVQPGCGVWAPAIRFHAGKFWIFFPMPDEGIYVTCTEDPAGAWEEPWCLAEAKGWIDPCPFWDDDGQAYLFHAYANSRAGKKERIHIRPMSPDCRALLNEGKEVIHTPHHLYLEGPKVHKERGWYYILAPGGGVQTGWQVAFRSREIWGPYEEKVVLERGSTAINGPHQGALVDLANGDWWFLHFQDVGPFGRITHLQPVQWVDDWPLMGADYDGNGVGEPVGVWVKPEVGGSYPVAIPPAGDEFDQPQLSLAWQWNANHQAHWADLGSRPGWLRLPALPGPPELHLELLPHFLGQKFPAREFQVETLVDFTRLQTGDIVGLAILGGSENVALAARRQAAGAELLLIINGALMPICSLEGEAFLARVQVRADGTFRFSAAGEGAGASEYPLPQTEFQASEGGWIGARVGLFSLATNAETLGGAADFHYFRFSAPKAAISG